MLRHHSVLGRLYTLHDAAAELRQKPRTIAKIARRHGLCSIFGRNLFFSEADIAGIWQVQRLNPSDDVQENMAMRNLERRAKKQIDERSIKRLARRLAVLHTNLTDPQLLDLARYTFAMARKP